ncbi:MAG: DUF2267 domain-containing protein [Alphaproteobacteria bacterium]|nr:DUF2267 domain-containing protein [Alphaproteobacteria bacterium]
MTVPREYKHASEDFYAFLEDAERAAMLQTSHQTYTMVDAVLQVFRRRLTPSQVLVFAGVLPPCLRALFVENWHPGDPVLPFAHRASLTHEVQSVRSQHNFSPDDSIAAVANALHLNVDRDAFADVLQKMPEGSATYWAQSPP